MLRRFLGKRVSLELPVEGNPLRIFYQFITCRVTFMLMKIGSVIPKKKKDGLCRNSHIHYHVQSFSCILYR